MVPKRFKFLATYSFHPFLRADRHLFHYKTNTYDDIKIIVVMNVKKAFTWSSVSLYN
jgi:hypothetical protein